jgi:hypothetical protein
LLKSNPEQGFWLLAEREAFLQTNKNRLCNQHHPGALPAVPKKCLKPSRTETERIKGLISVLHKILTSGRRIGKYIIWNNEVIPNSFGESYIFLRGLCACHG